jgi:hypothetical protein
MKTLISTLDYTVNQSENEVAIYIHSDDKSEFINCGLRIAFTISDCMYSLKKSAYTKDLEEYWNTCMGINSYVGLSFLLNYLKVPQDVKKDDAITNLMYEMLDFLANRYLKLWELINTAYPKIKTFVSNCPTTSEALFLKVVEYERKRSFEVMVENSYLEYSPSQLSKFSTEVSKEQHEIDWEKVKLFTPNYTRNNIDHPLCEVMSAINKTTAKGKNRKIAYLGEQYNLAMRYYWDSVKRFTKARSRDGNKIHKTLVSKNGFFEVNSYGRNVT